MTCERAQLFLDGRLVGAELQEFEVHQATCAECQALVASWKSFSADFVKSTAPMLAAPNDFETRRLLNKTRRVSPARAVAFGVVLAAAASVALVFWLRPVAEVVVSAGPVVLEATASARREVLGDDELGLTAGSAVELKERSATRVEVKLVRGSVAASVQKRAPGSSFVVSAGEYEVKVVGTRFRVEKLSAGVRVSVVEGLVRVSARGEVHDVAAGQVLEFDSAGARTTAFARTGFAELGDVEETVVDAGVVAVPVPVAVVQKPVSATQLTAWRQAAATNQCPRVLPELVRAANEHRKQAAVWRVLADCQRLTGDAKSARVSYEQVIVVGAADDAARARPVLASLLQDELGEHRAAVKVLTEYLKSKPKGVLEASARVKLARSFIALGDSASAKRELKRVVAELPSSPPAIEALELLKTL